MCGSVGDDVFKNSNKRDWGWKGGSIVFTRVGITVGGEVNRQVYKGIHSEKYGVIFEELIGKPRSPYIWHADCHLPSLIVDHGRLVFASDYPYSSAIASVWSCSKPILSIALLSGLDKYHDDSLLGEFGESLPDHLRHVLLELPKINTNHLLYSVALSDPISSEIESALAFVFFIFDKAREYDCIELS